MKNKLTPIEDKIMLRKRSIIETINDYLKGNLTPVVVIGTYNKGVNLSLTPYKISSQIIIALSSTIEGYEINATIEAPQSLVKFVGPALSQPAKLNI